MKPHVRIRPACQQQYPDRTMWAVDWYDGRGAWTGTECGPFTKRKAKSRASRARRILQREEEERERRDIARMAKELLEVDREKAGSSKRAAVSPVR